MDAEIYEQEDYVDYELPPTPQWASDLSPIVVLFASMAFMAGAVVVVTLLAGRSFG